MRNDFETSADHLKAIIENVVEGIITIDDCGIIQSINPAALKIFGYTHDELLGKNVSMLMPTPYQENHDTYLSNYRETGVAKIISIGREVFGRRKNGEIFPMDLAVGEVNLPKQRLFTGIVRDISERKNSEIQVRQLARSLQEKNQELESVVYIASHDMRSPLVNIQGFSIELSHSCRRLKHLMDKLNVEDPVIRSELQAILADEIPESLEFIFAGVHKMDGLLTGFLKFSRLGRVSMEQRRLNLNPLVREVLAAMKFQIQQKNVQIELGQLPECFGDPSQLNQVFSNIIDNAIKYSHPDRPPPHFHHE
ncbi:MAG: PAS domain S-box protein [Verrucomicrobia bacterium]|nr:PAS domain S-box protein [Verrucomicrobiota bacterium]